MPSIDLNCDLGEGFGAYQIGHDVQILPYITSANIACGFHAGDPAIMRRTVQNCLKYDVAIGAHPGLPDLAGFGRRAIAVTPDEVYEMVLYQIGALQAFVWAEGGKLTHVKPHGALYNMAAQDRALADAIAKAVHDLDRSLLLFGLSQSELIRAGEQAGLRCANEVFADRTYQKDGSLTSRRLAGSVHEDEADAVGQVLHMLEHGTVKAVCGTEIPIQADTICLHGDGEHAVPFAQTIAAALREKGCTLRPLT